MQLAVPIVLDRGGSEVVSLAITVTVPVVAAGTEASHLLDLAAEAEAKVQQLIDTAAVDVRRCAECGDELAVAARFDARYCSARCRMKVARRGRERPG